MSGYPQILGVFSLRKRDEVGTGATAAVHDQVTYWYVRSLEENVFEVQPLNAHHVPSGIRSVVNGLNFLKQYSPEPTYYAHHTVPAMETLRRKLDAGAEHFDAGRLDKAEREFIKALMIDEMNVEGNYSLGEVYSEQQEYNKLKKIIDVLLTLDEAFGTEQRQRFNSFGISLRKNGHYDESLRFYEKSLEYDDKDENVYFNMARVLYEKGSLSECVESLRRALHLNPQFKQARQFLKFCGVPA